MEKEKNKIWFPAKKYGIGWGFRVAWQGRMVLLIYVLLLVIVGMMLFRHPVRIFFFITYIMVLSALLVYICWKKGERIDIWRDVK